MHDNHPMPSPAHPRTTPPRRCHRRGRLWRRGAVLAAAAIVLTACVDTPSRKAEAQRLDDEISAMAGVESYSAAYANDFTQGTHLDIDLRMRNATEAQIVAATERIVEIKGDAFDGYDQSTEITVGDGLTLRRGAVLDPKTTGGDATALRRMGAQLPGAEIVSGRGDTGASVEVREAPPVGQVLDAVRETLGDDATEVTVRPADHQTTWTVDFPFTPQVEQRFAEFLAQAPLDATMMTISGGHVEYLIVVANDPATAYLDLTAIINAAAPTKEHPLHLRWVSGARTGEKSFTGSVHIAGCTYSPTVGENEPEKYYTPEAIALQTRLRAEFDACQ